MEIRTDERLLRNIEGYLMQLVSRVESLSIDEVSLIAEVLASVQDTLRTWPTSHAPLTDPRSKTSSTSLHFSC
jgi:hypothetical protein